MSREKKKEKVFMEFIVCPDCKYNNKPKNVELYGTCLRCHKVLDEKSKFKHDMINKLHLWKGKKWYD